ncbi:hypothetical protein [Mesoflavibacter zeaxanthinifaciens]|uniref:hypothetical protein n=1 Tax=Mesoflavibacter zeaxanthinifaciens TaxID=393060 RepID=UPI003A9417B6
MNANDVYNIAKALPKEELYRLYDMLKGNIKADKTKLSSKQVKNQMPDFTLEDSIKYLIENHFNKKRIP